MKILGKFRIRTQLMIPAVVTLLVMAVTFFFTYFEVIGNISNNSNQYNTEMITQIKHSILDNCQLLNKITKNIAYNMTVQKFLTENDPLQRYNEAKSIDNFINNIKDIKDGILNIEIIGENGNRYSLNGTTKIAAEVARNVKIGKGNYYSGIKVLEYQRQKKDCFVIILQVYALYQENMLNKEIGEIAMEVDTKTLGLNIQEQPEGPVTKFYLLDRDGKVYSSNVENSTNVFHLAEYNNRYLQEPSIISFHGERSILQAEDMEEIGGKIVSIVSEKDLFRNLYTLRQFVIIIFLIILVLMSIPFIVITNNMMQPLTKLIKFMSIVKSGNLKDLKKRVDLNGCMEIKTVSNEFNTMFEEINSLTHKLLETNSQLYDAELGKKQSELAFLRSQINPHFLYNTLEVMKGIAVVKGVNEIKEMSAALGQIFRYSINGDDFVLLKDEVDVLKAYVQIQQICFTDRIEVTYEFSQEVLEHKVLKMILQPLIENAIFHGLESKINKGHLWIGGIFEGNDLVIWVKDDGVGIDQDILDKLHLSLSQDMSSKRMEENSRTQIGITNVNNRIKLTYGKGYGISIKSDKRMGTEVLLRMPAMEGNNA